MSTVDMKKTSGMLSESCLKRSSLSRTDASASFLSVTSRLLMTTPPTAGWLRRFWQEYALVLAADTVVSVGRRVLPKVEDEATLRACMKLLSGRRHRVMTGVALAAPRQPVRTRLVETMIAMKPLSQDEIDYYAAHGEWRGKAGGYALQGYGEVYVRHIAGSYSYVVGLRLAETRVLLKAAGYPIA